MFSQCCGVRGSRSLDLQTAGRRLAVGTEEPANAGCAWPRVTHASNGKATDAA